MSLEKFGHALLDASMNALAIFALTLGGIILSSNGLDTGFSLRAPLLTSSAVGLIRFSLRLYQEEGVNLKGMQDLPFVPSFNSESNNYWNPHELTRLCKII